MKGLKNLALAVLSLALAAGLGPLAPAASAQTAAPADPLIMMATTTSTDQSGLLDYLKPFFEKETGYKIQWVAVGTGASLKIGEKGDCDVVLVHARSLEDAFMAAGFGAERKDVMYNDFIILGPAADPAGIASAKSAAEALALIAKTGSSFISRGDNSGTDVKEKEVWKATGVAPKGAVWYKEAGQGMAQVIVMADQLGAYTISDRATWLNMKDKFGLKILNQGDKVLFNPYGVITVNPAKWPKTNIAGARVFMNWLTGPRGRELIAAYKIGGEQCFYLY